MFEQGLNVIGHGISFRFALLRHNIGNIDLQRIRSADRIHDTIHQQIGNDTGIETSRPQNQNIRIFNGSNRRRQRF